MVKRATANRNKSNLRVDTKVPVGVDCLDKYLSRVNVGVLVIETQMSSLVKSANRIIIK